MKLFYCDHFVLPLPPEHRFPMSKYSRLRARILEEGVVREADLLVPEGADDEALGRVHDPDWIRRVREGRLSIPEIRRIGFPWSPGLVERSRRSVGGTMAAGRWALDSAGGISVNLAGGTHHAFRDRGEGFCVFNDVAVAIRDLQHRKRIRKAAVLDLDVHQGNGTASIFADDPTVFTLSVHGAGNYPFRKERSDLDLELPDGTGDDAFLEAARRGIRLALDRGMPDLVFFLAGADPHEDDRLGRLSVSFDGLRERDEMVFDLAAQAGVPVAVVMAGGYGRRVEDTVQIHFQTVQAAARRTWGSVRESARSA